VDATGATDATRLKDAPPGVKDAVGIDVSTTSFAGLCASCAAPSECPGGTARVGTFFESYFCAPPCPAEGCPNGTPCSTATDSFTGNPVSVCAPSSGSSPGFDAGCAGADAALDGGGEYTPCSEPGDCYCPFLCGTNRCVAGCNVTADCPGIVDYCGQE
jgi:hypothetical protein